MRYVKNKSDDFNDILGITRTYRLNLQNGSTISAGTVIPQQNMSDQMYTQMGQQINAISSWANKPYGLDTHNFAYQIETNKGFFVLIYGENVVKFIERIISKKEQNNLRGGLSYTSKIKDKPIEICDAIIFKDCDRYQREDKPGKEFFNVYTSTDVNSNFEGGYKVIEGSDLNSSHCCLKFKPEIVRAGQEALCSEFFRSEIYRVSKSNDKTMIPLRPGWYKDDIYGWVFLEKYRYKNLPDNELPPAMRRRLIGKTSRTPNEVYKDLEAIIGKDWRNRLLWGIRLAGPILLLLGLHEVTVKTIIAPIVENIGQFTTVAAIIKTGDFFDFDTLSLGSKEDVIEREISSARDGVAAVIGPMTVAEAKLNRRKALFIRDIAIGAGGAAKNTRTLISLIGRFLPNELSPEFVLLINCMNMCSIENANLFRSLVLEFDAAYISYLEMHFDVVEGWVQSAIDHYNSAPIVDMAADKKGIYVALRAVQELINGCFGIRLFKEEELSYVENCLKTVRLSVHLQIIQF